MLVIDRLLKVAHDRGAGFLVLIDPDEQPGRQLVECAHLAEEGGADAILIGGSGVLSAHMENVAQAIKREITIPLIIFPGGANQLCRFADAVLFTSLLSGRNPEYLIGEQVKGAPLVREFGLEAIPTAYLLIESGARTSVEFYSHTHPIPRHETEFLKAHALAAQYLGMRLVYLEAGSGAIHTVPEDMIAAVKETVSLPIICGGGIRRPDTAARKVAAGAQFIVVGNRFEESSHRTLFFEFADAIHSSSSQFIRREDERP
jgi:phosphoglycerol geranylgeranyltransferase